MIRSSCDLNELKFSREQGFFDKSLSVRALIAFVFISSLFFILHFREVKIEALELGSIAPKYIVAQVDVDFQDDEATLILKQRATAEIGNIYKISDSQIRHRRQEFENYLVSDLSWQDKVGGSFEEMYSGVDALEKTLSHLRFTDSKTLKKAQEAGLSVASYQVFTPKEPQVMLPQKVWDEVQKELGLESARSGAILSYFKNQKWELADDIPTQKELGKFVQAKIPETKTHMSAGSRIIDQGDRVTGRHLSMLQAVKERVGESRNLWRPLTLLGSLILTLLLTALCMTYFHLNYPDILRSNRKLFLVVTVIVMTFVVAKGTEFFLLNSKYNLIELFRYPLFVPFAAIILCSLINPAVATFIGAFLATTLAITLTFDRHGFLLINMAASLVAILSARLLKRRKDVFAVCAKAWFCSALVLLSIYLYQNYPWKALPQDLLSTGGFLLITAVFVVGLLPLLESGFKIMTDVTLMEYMDPNHPLLRRLSIEAPGTYQHSIVVGNLAEAAALSIGANGLFCRVSTLYHDIGKMATPQYFTENQHGGVNIHQLLTPEESAQVIINHVTEGVVMARKAGLPEQFIDVIKEHHGTTLVYYFYRRQLEKMDMDKNLVDEKDFRYVGPKPRTKESALIMIADSLEAASRSLDDCGELSVEKLVEQIIKEKAEDGQFDDCLITFEEMAMVKKTMAKTLSAFSHARIKYPKKPEPEQVLV
jgi:putative nucleotidyltransferase with HDIG domain